MYILMETLIQITNLLVILIVTLFILPASAFMYASGSPENSDNSDGSSDSGSTDNGGGSSSSDFSNDNVDSLSDGPTRDNTDLSAASTENNPTLSSESALNNNTGNVQGADLANSILAVHNQERAAVGVQPLTWSDTLAASAQTWAQHLATSGEFKHSPDTSYGENLAGFTLADGVSAPGGGLSIWVDEKSKYVPGTPASSSTGHYTQMVDKQSTQVGCGTATGDGHPFSILVCQYSPPGNWNGKPPY
jgi:uncharacterized protein YkwD